MVPNALTVDVEEYFHAENLRAAYPREKWESLESRVEEPLERLLEVLRARGVRATFFVLGWLAERKPALLDAIRRDGHEVGSHGYGHELLTRLDRESFAEDVKRSLEVLGPVRGYRAPCFTIGPSTRWALEVLAELGFAYDSSIFPVSHDRYGDPRAPRAPHAIDVGWGKTIVEAPPATLRLMGRNFAVAGGGWLRLLPWRVCAAGVKQLNRSGVPAVLYLHPWELDAQQPVHEGVSWRKRLRHGIGTKRLTEKLEALLDRIALAPLATVLEAQGLLAGEAEATRRAAA